MITRDDTRRQNNLILVLGVVLGFAFILRIAWIYWMPTTPISDFGWYYDRAQSILAGQGYSVKGSPTAQFPPGYPYFLALVLKLTGGLAGVKLVQALLGTLTCYLVYRLARVVASEAVALVAATLTAVYPNFIFYSNLLASENLFMPLLLLGLLILLDDRIKLGIMTRSWLAGLVFGFGALTRPAIVLFPAICFVWLTIRRVGFVNAVGVSALVAAAMLTIVTPWTIRNALVMGRPVVISSNGGTVFWMSNSRLADGGRWYPPGNPVEQVKNEILRSDIGYRLAVNDIKEDPGRFGRTITLKYRRFFRAPDGLGWTILDTKDRDWTKENLSSPFYIRDIHGFNAPVYYYWRRKLAVLEYLLWMLAGAGSLALLRRDKLLRERLLMVILLYLYWFGFHLVFAFGHMRFVMPLVPLNLILAATALMAMIGAVPTWLRERASLRVTVPISLWVVGYSLYRLGLHIETLMGPANRVDEAVGVIFGLLVIISTLILAARALWSRRTPRQHHPTEQLSGTLNEPMSA